MRFRIAIVAILSIALTPCAASALVTYSTSQFDHVIAQAVVPDRNNEQLYFSVLAGTFWASEAHRWAPADGIYYQFSGIVELESAGRIKTLEPGDGIFLAAGTEFTVKPRAGQQPPTYLEFLLSPTPEAAVTGADDGSSIELYRSPTPVPGLMHERNLLSLSRVPVPPQSLPDPLHRRTGAALHYILSGVGAESAAGHTVARGPGSVSFEPAGYTYQMSNPGLKPLIYLLFNVNQKDVAPVVAQDERPSDPFARDPHLTWAMYCVAISMILTVVVSSGTIADYHKDRHRKMDRDDDDW